MKKKSKILLVAFTAVYLLGTGWAPAQEPRKPVVLKVAGVFPSPAESMMSEFMKTWQDEVTKRTKGAVTFENSWKAALGTPAAHIDLVKKGTVQVAQTHEWYTPARFPIGNFEYIFPFGPTNYSLVGKAMRQIRTEFPQFAQDETRENVVMICNPPGGVYDFMSKKPLKTIADFKGEKVSLVGRYFGRWLPPGASAVVCPAAERYNLLRDGGTSTDLNPFDNFYAFKIYEMAKYYINAKLTVACWGPVLMNLDTFKGFSPEVQKIFLEAGKEVESNIAPKIVLSWWHKCQREWKEKGIHFITIPDEEIQKWASGLEDIPAEFAKEVETKGYPGYKIAQRWQEITGELGYKWPRKWGLKK